MLGRTYRGYADTRKRENAATLAKAEKRFAELHGTAAEHLAAKQAVVDARMVRDKIPEQIAASS